MNKEDWRIFHDDFTSMEKVVCERLDRDFQLAGAEWGLAFDGPQDVCIEGWLHPSVAVFDGVGQALVLTDISITISPLLLAEVCSGAGIPGAGGILPCLCRLRGWEGWSFFRVRKNADCYAFPSEKVQSVLVSPARTFPDEQTLAGRMKCGNTTGRAVAEPDRKVMGFVRGLRKRIRGLVRSVESIRKYYPKGFVSYAEKCSWDTDNLRMDGLQLVVDHKQDIKEMNVLQRAADLQKNCPLAFESVMGCWEGKELSPLIAQLAVHQASVIRERQQVFDSIGSSMAVHADYRRMLKAMVSRWRMASDELRYAYFKDYYPYATFKGIATREMKDTWSYVYGFKDTEKGWRAKRHRHSVERAAEDVAQLLKQTFGEMCPMVTLVCLAASTAADNERRYRQFSYLVRKQTGLLNAFPHIRVVEDGEPVHFGGKIDVKKEYDVEWFRDKFVVLFDDVRTKGTALLKEKRRLESMGATVLCAITLAQTVEPDRLLAA